jgi:hypothetical protein
MSTHYVPIKPATTLIDAHLSADHCSLNINSFDSSSSADLASASTNGILTIYERNLIRNPPYHLTLSPESLLDPTRKHRKNRVKKNFSPPRPQNAWVIFRKNFEGQLRAQDQNKTRTIQEVSKMAGKEWKNQPNIVKQYFDALSKLAQHRHKIAYPNYSYRPKRNKQDKSKNWLFKEINKDRITGFENQKESTDSEKENRADASTPTHNEENNQSEFNISGNFNNNNNNERQHPDLRLGENNEDLYANNVNEYHTREANNMITPFDSTPGSLVPSATFVPCSLHNRSNNFDISAIHSNATVITNVMNIGNGLLSENTFQTLALGDHNLFDITNVSSAARYPSGHILFQLHAPPSMLHHTDFGTNAVYQGYAGGNTFERWDGNGMCFGNEFDVC